MPVGTFITIYGINNIGKTYHARRLCRRLIKLGKKARYLKYPIYTQKPTGPLLNKILRSAKKHVLSEEELQLLFVLNRYQFQPTLLKMLVSGTIVVAEDYIGTSIAWGMAKTKKPVRIRTELENMNKFLVQENISILLDGKRVASAREKYHLHERDEKLLARCQNILRRLSRDYKWHAVSVSGDKDITAARIWKIVHNRI